MNWGAEKLDGGGGEIQWRERSVCFCLLVSSFWIEV